MKYITKNNNNTTKWAFFGLFFCIFLVFAGVIISWRVEAISNPISAPPDNNTPDYLLIDGSTQAKQGSLRLGTSDVTSPFNYQLEVLGEGAASTSAIIDQNLKVSKTSDTLFVDSVNNKICVGPCLGVNGSALEISGGTWSITSTNAHGMYANSGSAEALYGANTFTGVGTGSSGPGIQGTSQSGTGTGVTARSLGATGVLAQSASGQEYFDKVWIYGGSVYYDLTAAAASPAQNDIYYNSASYGFLYSVNDALYFGRQNPFNSIVFNVKNYNTSGSYSITWQYCSAVNAGGSCTTWTSFTPSSGAYNFRNTDPEQNKVTLWATFPPTPTWQSAVVNGSNSLFYVRAVVTSANVGGIPRSLGSQITPGVLSSAYGSSGTGYGVYASNTNPYGVWAGYFSGRLEGSRDISGAKFVSTQLQQSLIPQTAGQVVDKYFRNYYPSRAATDGSFLYIGQKGTLVNGTWYGDEVLKVDKASGKVVQEYALDFTSDLIYDGTYIWQARDNYPGGIGRINVSTNVAESRTILNMNPPDPYGDGIPNGNETCPMGYIARGGGNTLWAVQPGLTNCFGYAYHDRLLRFDISTFTNDPNTWAPNLQIEFDHVRQNPSSVVYDGASVWIAFKDNNSVYKINAGAPDPNADNRLSIGEYIAIAVPGPTDLAYDAVDNVIWVASDEAGTTNDGAYSINRTSNALSGRVVTTTGYAGELGPWAIAYDGTRVWVGTNSQSNTGYVDKFDAVAAIANPGTVPVSHIPTTIGRTENDILYDSSVNAVWAVSRDSSNAIARINATSGTVQSVFDYSLKNVSVKTFDGTYLWMFDGSYLWKVRASDGFKIWQKSIGSDPSDVIFDANNIWVTLSGTGQVLKINPADGMTLCTIPLAAGSHPQSIVFDGQYYWVVASGQGDVLKISSGCAVVSSIHLTGAVDSLTKVIYSGNRIWVMSPAESMLYAINSSTGHALGYVGIVTGDSTEIVFDNANFWVLNSARQTVTKFFSLPSNTCSVPQVPAVTNPQNDGDCDPTGGCFSELSLFGEYGVGDGASYAVFDGAYLWTANTTDQSLTRLNISLPSDRMDFALPNTPTGVVFDGTYIYVSLAENGVVKIYSGTGYGEVNLGRALTLQGNDVAIPQSGNFNISGSARVGGTATVGGDLSAPNNTWGGTGDYVVSGSIDSAWSEAGSIPGATSVHSMFSAADGSLYAGVYKSGDNHGYVYHSTDGGITWINTGDLANATAINHITQAPDGTLYASGLSSISDFGVVYKSTNGGADWTQTGAIPAAPGTFRWSNELLIARDGSLYLVGEGGIVWKSTDTGTTWTGTAPIAGIVELTSLVQDADGVIYAGGSGVVYKTYNGGITWTPTGALTGSDQLYDLMAASDGSIYAGTANSTTGQGDVYRSVDSGSSWQMTTHISGVVTVTTILQSSDGSVYAGTWPGCTLSKTTDYGVTWTPVNISGCTADVMFQLIQARDGSFFVGTGISGKIYKLSVLKIAGNQQVSCPVGQYLKNIFTNSSGAVTRIECRPL